MKYGAIATVSVLAINLLSYPASTLAEIENKTSNSIEAIAKETQENKNTDAGQQEETINQNGDTEQKEQEEVQQEEISSTEEPQHEMPVQENPAETKLDQASVTVAQKTYQFESVFYTYNDASISSGMTGSYAPQAVVVHEERGTWIKIETEQGLKWANTKPETRDITTVFYTYNEASISSGVTGSYAPQTVVVYEQKGDWFRIQTDQGLKWVNTKLETRELTKAFYTYNEASISSGITGFYAPQTVVVYEQKGDWIRIQTEQGLKWVNTKPETRELTKAFYTYNEASISSGMTGFYAPQTVVVYEQKGDWIRIQTEQGLKWVNTKPETRDMTTVFYVYNDASISSGIAGVYAPQTVVVYEQKGDWIRIQTGQGLKWVNTKPETRDMTTVFYTYNEASISSGIAGSYAPQTVVVYEQKGDWIHIQTEQGLKWVNTKPETRVMDKPFYAYNSPSFTSGKAGYYAPQTVVVYEKNGDWIRIQTSQGLKWVNIVSAADELSEKVIIIDPGHGGADGGHTGVVLDEDSIVYDTSVRLQNLIDKKSPFTVLMTRNGTSRPGTDSKDSLAKRVQFGQQNQGDIFVSIHANGYDGSVTGTETYYWGLTGTNKNPYVTESRALADNIQKRLVKSLQTNNRGVKHGDLYVVRENTIPAVLAELGFIDNWGEGKKLSDPYWRQLAAEAIYAGILDYYEWQGFDMSSYR